MRNDSKGSKTLIFRLSSLGDVILASAALGPAHATGHSSVDWVVSSEFAPVLDGDPRIRRLWVFDRKSGIRGWWELCRQLWREDYNDVLDLHSSLRTRLAWWAFLVFSVCAFKPTARPRWTRIHKERFRLYGYFIFKKFWPNYFRPHSVREIFAKLAGGTGDEVPDLRWLSSVSSKDEGQGSQNTGLLADLIERDYLCVMPASAWEGKRWPVRSYFETLQRLDILPVILGGKDDLESLLLVKLFQQAGLPHVSGVGEWDLRKVAFVLSHSKGYFGNDTGLGHLAEAMGIPAHVIFGPTVPDMGFGPSNPLSRTYGAGLWCRPCGKDGRFCFRFSDRYQCLKMLGPAQVTAGISGKAPHENTQ